MLINRSHVEWRISRSGSMGYLRQRALHWTMQAVSLVGCQAHAAAGGHEVQHAAQHCEWLKPAMPQAAMAVEAQRGCG
jgi:predicted DNA repair protein MutK